MIVVVNDSIQKPLVKTQVTTPAKSQTPAKSLDGTTPKTQVQGKSQVPANVQATVKSHTAIQGQTKIESHVKAEPQTDKMVQNQTATLQSQHRATSGGTDKLLELMAQSDSIQAIRKDSILQAQKKDTAVVDTMPLFYKTHFIPGDSIKWTSTGHQPSGLDGNARPYRLQTDDAITGLLLFCFILTAYVFANGKKGLFEQTKNLFSRKEHSDFLGRATASDLRYRVMLQLQTCIIMGIFCFNYFHDYNPQMLDRTSTYCILGIYIGIFILYYGIKWLIYKFLGWIFFDKYITSAWLEAYSTIIHSLGLCIFPSILLMVYSGLSASTILIIGLILVIFAKILMFHKWLTLFFKNMYGLLFLIVYFCALEILPCFLLIQGLLQTNIILQIKL